VCAITSLFLTTHGLKTYFTKLKNELTCDLQNLSPASDVALWVIGPILIKGAF